MIGPNGKNRQHKFTSAAKILNMRNIIVAINGKDINAGNT